MKEVEIVTKKVEIVKKEDILAQIKSTAKTKTKVERAGNKAIEIIVDCSKVGMGNDEIITTLNRAFPAIKFNRFDIYYFLKKNNKTMDLICQVDEEIAKLRARTLLSYNIQLTEGIDELKKQQKELLDDPSISKKDKIIMLVAIQDQLRKHIFAAARLSGKLKQTPLIQTNIHQNIEDGGKLQQILARAPSIMQEDTHENKETNSEKLSEAPT